MDFPISTSGASVTRDLLTIFVAYPGGIIGIRFRGRS